MKFGNSVKFGASMKIQLSLKKCVVNFVVSETQSLHFSLDNVNQMILLVLYYIHFRLNVLPKL